MIPQSAIIRVLVADDSSFMRVSLTQILEADSLIKVIDTAADGEETIQKVKKLRPEVVLLDIQMPGMDGLSALTRIMNECPTPVLMLSALNKADATVAFKSLSLGAVDFIPKPSDFISYDIDKLSAEIITKVKVAAAVNMQKFAPVLAKPALKRRLPKTAAHKKIVVIGASTGGPRALAVVLAGLRRDITAAILVVQHMGPEFLASFVERLQKGSLLKISLAQKDEYIRSGQVLVAPGDCYTTIAPDNNHRKIRFNRNASPEAAFPSIDYAMESAARTYGENSLGVLLTGIGSDGVKGMKAIKDAGGRTIAEDEATCVVYGMPKAALESGCVDELVPLPRIAETILRML